MCRSNSARFCFDFDSCERCSTNQRYDSHCTLYTLYMSYHQLMSGDAIFWDREVKLASKRKLEIDFYPCSIRYGAIHYCRWLEKAVMTLCAFTSNMFFSSHFTLSNWVVSCASLKCSGISSAILSNGYSYLKNGNVPIQLSIWGDLVRHLKRAIIHFVIVFAHSDFFVIKKSTKFYNWPLN